MNDIDKDFMRKEYTKNDVCDIKKNPYVGKFTSEEKQNAYDKAFKVILKDEYDFKDGVEKNYSDKFTREEKLKAMIECFLAVEKIDKKELYTMGGDNNMHPIRVSPMFADLFKEEREEGREEGIQEGRTVAFKELVKNGMLSVENAAKSMNVSVEKFNEMMATGCDEPSFGGWRGGFWRKGERGRWKL